MQEKKNAVINITKAIAGVSFATLAAMGSASGNVWLAGLATLPMASLASSEIIGTQLSKITQHDELVELPMPSWWGSDSRSWQNLCAEIGTHLPHILLRILEALQQEQRVVTLQVVRQSFIEAVVGEHLTWSFDPNERRRVAEFIASPLLLGIDASLRPLIEQKQRETYLTDTHTTTSSTQSIESHTRKMAELLEKIYEDGQRQHEHLIVDDETIQKQEILYLAQPSQRKKVSVSEVSTSKPIQSVVILTALPVEYKAVRSYLTNLREEVHPQGTVYEHGTFTGAQQAWEIILVEIGMGGTQAALEAERAIHHFKPNVVLFVGVAGGLKDVKIGDVVAATRVYGYESGKEEGTGFKTRPSIGQSTYRMEQRAKAEARKDSWLQRIISAPMTIAPTVYVAPIAAGEKVVASTSSATWQLLRENFSDALAVEMEGHGFLVATHANAQVEALIIRGISDLVDGKREADTAHSQQLAAQHASAFAFEVLAHLDVQELQAHIATVPRFGTPFPNVWNVTRRQKMFFTGRSPILKRLYDSFVLDDEMGLVAPLSIHGTGGLGKTQTAAEYAYRYRSDYQAVLWVKAASEIELLNDYKAIARLLKLPEALFQNREQLIATMMEWFRMNTEWLLILDNADNIAMIQPFLPRAARGHILLTTRSQTTSGVAQRIEVEKLSIEDSALFLLRRTYTIPLHGQIHDTTETKYALAKEIARLVDGLPLALEQAGAYIDETACGLRGYLNLYEKRRNEMVRIQSGPVPDYPTAVAYAWTLSRQSVQASDPTTIDLLYVCAFLAPDAIPDEIFTVGASYLGPHLQGVADDIIFNKTIATLRGYSLISRDVNQDTDISRLSIHRVIQDILRLEMDEKTQRLWAGRTVQAVNAAFPYVEWQIIQPHVQRCIEHIKQWQLSSAEAMQLLERVKKKSQV